MFPSPLLTGVHHIGPPVINRCADICRYLPMFPKFTDIPDISTDIYRYSLIFSIFLPILTDIDRYSRYFYRFYRYSWYCNRYSPIFFIFFRRAPFESWWAPISPNEPNLSPSVNVPHWASMNQIWVKMSWMSWMSQIWALMTPNEPRWAKSEFWWARMSPDEPNLSPSAPNEPLVPNLRCDDSQWVQMSQMQ